MSKLQAAMADPQVINCLQAWPSANSPHLSTHRKHHDMLDFIFWPERLEKPIRTAKLYPFQASDNLFDRYFNSSVKG
jgi:hypothetical protein